MTNEPKGLAKLFPDLFPQDVPPSERSGMRNSSGAVLGLMDRLYEDVRNGEPPANGPELVCLEGGLKPPSD